MVMRMQVVLQGRSGVPEDVFVNTYHIGTGQPFNEGDVDDLASDVFGAYAHVATGQTRNLNSYLSRFIDTSNSTIRVYNLDEPKPRTPHVAPLSLLGIPTGSEDLPEEVAICLTLRGAPPVTARRRGRLYMGPFNSTALGSDQGAGTGPSRPSTEFIQVVRSFGAEFLRAMQVHNWQWLIKSERPALNFVNVVGGYVDDAWDTQRRRGVDPQTRWTFPDTI